MARLDPSACLRLCFKYHEASFHAMPWVTHATRGIGLYLVAESVVLQGLIEQEGWIAYPVGSAHNDYKKYCGAEHCGSSEHHILWRFPPPPDTRWLVALGGVLATWAGRKDVESLPPEAFHTRKPGESPYVEPLLLQPWERMEAGRTYDYGVIPHPWSWNSPDVLEGRFIDAATKPANAVMLLLPSNSGLGAFVVSRSDGAYRVAGLPPGRYRAALLARTKDRLVRKLFELDIPAALERRDIAIEN